MYYSIISVALNIILNFAFIPFWGFGGLAAASSIAGLANLGLLIANMKNKIMGLSFSHLGIHLLKTIIGAFAALLIIKLLRIDVMIGLHNIWQKILVVSLQIAVMGLAYILILWFLKADEVRKFISLARRIF